MSQPSRRSTSSLQTASSRRALLLQAYSLAVALGLACPTMAAAGHCSHCQQRHSCRKVCRLVRKDRTITVTCWGCREEDFCMPGPSQRKCRHCEAVCNSASDTCDVCAQSKRLVWTEWLPGSRAHLMTRRKLMKRTVTRTVPGYQWVVEDLCAACESTARDAEIVTSATEQVHVPPPPSGVPRLRQHAPDSGRSSLSG